MYNLKEDNSILGEPQVGDVPFESNCGGYSWSVGGRQGWICPKCGRVLSPNTPSCPCSEPSVNHVSTNYKVPEFPNDYWNYLNKSVSVEKDFKDQ